MYRSRNRFRFGGALSALLLALACSATFSAEPGENGANQSAEVCMPGDCALFQLDEQILAVLPYPQRYYPSAETTEQAAPEWAGYDSMLYSYENQQNLAIDDEHWLISLADIESLSLKTFWEDHSSRLFLGVDKSGFAGLMFGQKDHSANYGPSDDGGPVGYMSEAEGGRPLLHSQSLTYELPDLSQETTKEED